MPSRSVVGASLALVGIFLPGGLLDPDSGRVTSDANVVILVDGIEPKEVPSGTEITGSYDGVRPALLFARSWTPMASRPPPRAHPSGERRRLSR
jgi:hypothetical protein